MKHPISKEQFLIVTKISVLFNFTNFFLCAYSESEHTNLLIIFGVAMVLNIYLGT